jgi:hypothetical protein
MSTGAVCHPAYQDGLLVRVVCHERNRSTQLREELFAKVGDGMKG